MPTALIHLAAGIGDIVLATPLLWAMHELDYRIDLLLDADYPATAELFEGWHLISGIYADSRPRFASYDRVLPCVPPFYWSRFARDYARLRNVVARPPDRLFYENVQRYYLRFANALGYPDEKHPACSLPIAPSEIYGVSASTVVLAPGSKTGEMAAKRWPHFVALSRTLTDIAVVGTPDDIANCEFPNHVRSFVGRLGLRQTAELLASAGLVVANDSGLAHLAVAVGTPALILFGPTPDAVFQPFSPATQVIRAGLPCEPCWHGPRFHACSGSIDCLRQISVQSVELAVNQLSYAAVGGNA